MVKIFNSSSYQQTLELNTKQHAHFYDELQSVLTQKRAKSLKTPKPRRLLTIQGFREKFILKGKLPQEFKPNRLNVSEDDISTTASIKKRYNFH